MKMLVSYIDTASFTIEVDIPDDTPEDERKDAALDAADEKGPDGRTPLQRQAPGSLCHHCSGKWELSESVEPSTVWSAEE